jgi:RNA-binding protein
MLKLTAAETSALRSEAHALNPIVLIGDAGLTEAVMKEIDAGLSAHGLIKVRVFSDDREARITFFHNICTTLKAAPIQHIGKLLIVYRPKAEAKKVSPGASNKVGKGLREVTIIKSSASGTKRPTFSKVVLKGNERVTAGGNIKRAKARQTSSKKNALK